MNNAYFALFAFLIVFLVALFVYLRMRYAQKDANRHWEHTEGMRAAARLRGGGEPYAEGGQRGSSRRTRIHPHEPIVVVSAMVLENGVDDSATTRRGGPPAAPGQLSSSEIGQSVYPTASVNTSARVLMMVPPGGTVKAVPAQVAEEVARTDAANIYGEAVYLPQSDGSSSDAD